MDSSISFSHLENGGVSSKSNPSVKIDGLSHWFGKGYMRRQVLDSISMEIALGEVVLLTGPSGCGKTTLLTLIGALRKVEKGSLTVFDCGLGPTARRTGANGCGQRRDCH